MIGRSLDPDLSSTPTYNKRLALPSTGIVLAAISSKTSFVEWYIARGGWVSYASYFLAPWPGSDLIIGFSTSVPIKREVVEEIGATTPVGKSKEKKLKKDACKKFEAEEGVKGIEAGQGIKKRKTALARKYFVISKDLGEVDSSTAGKEVSNPPIPKIRVKTKVETSIL